MRDEPHKLALGFQHCSTLVGFLLQYHVVHNENYACHQHDPQNNQGCIQRQIGGVNLDKLVSRIERNCVGDRPTIDKFVGLWNERPALFVAVICGVVSIPFSAQTRLAVFHSEGEDGPAAGLDHDIQSSHEVRDNIRKDVSPYCSRRNKPYETCRVVGWKYRLRNKNNPDSKARKEAT